MGKEHPDTLISLNALAMVALNLGEPEAIELITRVRDVRRRTLGERHPHTMNSGHNLGTALAMNGRLTDALATLEDVYVARSEELGADHPSTLLTALHLARSLSRDGQTADAERLLRDGLERGERTLGANAELCKVYRQQLLIVTAPDVGSEPAR